MLTHILYIYNSVRTQRSMLISWPIDNGHLRVKRDKRRELVLWGGSSFVDAVRPTMYNQQCTMYNTQCQMLWGQLDPSWEAPTWSQQKWPGCLENWPVLRLWAMHIEQYSVADPRSIETHQMTLQDWLEHNKAAENIDILTEKCKFTTHDWLIQRWFGDLVTKLAKLAHHLISQLLR